MTSSNCFELPHLIELAIQLQIYKFTNFTNFLSSAFLTAINCIVYSNKENTFYEAFFHSDNYRAKYVTCFDNELISWKRKIDRTHALPAIFLRSESKISD